MVRQSDESNMVASRTPELYPRTISCMNKTHKIYFLIKRCGTSLHLQQKGTTIFKYRQAYKIEHWERKPVYRNVIYNSIFVSFHWITDHERVNSHIKESPQKTQGHFTNLTRIVTIILLTPQWWIGSELQMKFLFYKLILIIEINYESLNVTMGTLVWRKLCTLTGMATCKKVSGTLVPRINVENVMKLGIVLE
jgi:hypothetical protein